MPDGADRPESRDEAGRPSSAGSAASSARPVYPPTVHGPGTAADDAEVVVLSAALGEDPMFVSRTLRSFVRDGRLTGIPARDRKKRVVIRWLRDTAFLDAGPWPEPEVNLRIALVHPDVSALRRLMVDAGLLVRDAGIYRRGTS
jgi:hypothetical protein